MSERVRHELRRHARRAAGRNPEASAGVIDSQPSKTTGQGGPRGFDGAKKVNGRERRLGHLWADQAYTGEFRRRVETKQGVELEVVYPWWRQIKRYLPGE